MKLLMTVLFGFIIPWIIGIILYFKDKKVIVLIAPFSGMLAFLLNTPGMVLGYFYPTVGSISPYLITGIVNMGLYSIEPCLLIFAINHTKIKPGYLLTAITLVSTGIDLVLLWTKMLLYDKGWNILWSFAWFFISYYAVYLYFLWLKRLHIFQ